jgi:hypothetical protein
VPDDFRTRVAGCVLRSAAFNRCAHSVPSGHGLARRGFFLLIFLSYSFGPPFLQQAMTDRPSETGSHARALLPDRRRRCRHRVSPEFVRCPRGCTAIKIINDQHITVNVPIDDGLKVGDIVALSPSHPFTTFEKWRLIWEVDDNYNVVGTIETFV